MPSPVELALTSLLPTLADLPPELVGLATSLLAQSRSKAANLKPDEEIGRTYGCCHIACQRLGHKLALEIGKPTPPVKPKVYAKLHTYLNSVLKTTVTPRKAKQDGGATKSTPASSSRTARATPSKADVKVSSTPTGKPSTSQEKYPEYEFPKYLPKLIRHLCKEMKAPYAIPHVLAGVDAICYSGYHHQRYMIGARVMKRARDEAVPESAEPALVITVLKAVVEKMHGDDSYGEDPYEEDNENEEFGGNEVVQKAQRVVKDYCERNAAHLGFELDDLQFPLPRFARAMRNTWMKMEWYDNIPSFQSTSDNGADEAAEDSDRGPLTPSKKRTAKTPLRRKEKHAKRGVTDDDDDDQEDVGPAGLQPALGTMFQPSIDWLSDERRADYARWERGIRREIAERA